MHALTVLNLQVDPVSRAADFCASILVGLVTMRAGAVCEAGATGAREPLQRSNTHLPQSGLTVSTLGLIVASLRNLDQCLPTCSQASALYIRRLQLSNVLELWFSHITDDSMPRANAQEHPQQLQQQPTSSTC
jgi:hypothetical protein